jgi:hypothetical protein
MLVYNREIAQAFRRAKTRMWTGEIMWGGGIEFLCIALERDDSAAAHVARNVVCERLAGRDTFCSWLHDAINVRQDTLDLAAIQRHKMKWVDMLIKEFESSGSKVRRY